MTRRNRFNMALDILETACEKINANQICRNANIDYRQLRPLLAKLISKGFLETSEAIDDPRVKYWYLATVRGKKLLREARAIQETLGMSYNE